MITRTPALHPSAFVLLLAVLTVSCAGTASQRTLPIGAANTGAGSLTSKRDYLEGTWTLVSFDVLPPDQPPITLKGQGQLVYDAFANLVMEIRADTDTLPLLEKAGLQATDGAISVRGRTVVDMQAQTLTYVPDADSSPGPTTGPLAISRPRHWEVTGDLLTLTTNDDAGRPLAVSRWRRR